MISYYIKLGVTGALLVKAPDYGSKDPGFKSPINSRYLLLFWVHLVLPYRRFSFASFRGDIKPAVPGKPFNISQSAIRNFLVNWVILGNHTKHNLVPVQ